MSFFEVAREIVSREAADRSARSGSLHGWVNLPAMPIRSVAEVVRDLEAEEARAEVFRQSPRGRFHKAAFRLYLDGHGGEVLAISDRNDFAREATAARAILETLQVPAAADALAALADIEA